MQEESSKRTKLIGYIITNVISIAFVLYLIFMYDLFKQTESKEIFNILCTAFFVPGVLCLLFAALIALSNEGSLDAISYMLRRLGQNLIPFIKKNDEKYADYVEKKKRVTGYSFMTWTGLVYTIISVIFLIIYFIV